MCFPRTVQNSSTLIISAKVQLFFDICKRMGIFMGKVCIIARMFLMFPQKIATRSTNPKVFRPLHRMGEFTKNQLPEYDFGQKTCIYRKKAVICGGPNEEIRHA